MMYGDSVEELCVEELAMGVRVVSLVGEVFGVVRLRGGSGRFFPFPNKSFSRPNTGDSLSKDSSIPPHTANSRIPAVSITCTGERLP